MLNTAALLRTVKSRWRIVRSSVQTVSIANSSYSEHIRSVHLIITSEHGIREVCDLYDPYGSKNRTHPLLPRNILRPTNEMQSSDRKQLFTDRTRVLQSIRILKWLIRTVTVLVYWTTLVSATPRNTQRTKTQKLALDLETIKHAQYRKKHTGYDTLELDMLSSWSREGTINFTVASNNATIFSRTDGLWVVGTL